MYLSPQELAVFEKLKAAGIALRSEEGDHLGRGYADLGSEEFLVLPGGKLLSLFRGTVSELTEDVRRFAFRVLTVDELTFALESREIELQSVTRLDARHWQVTARRQALVLDRKGKNLQAVLAEILLEFLTHPNHSGNTKDV